MRTINGMWPLREEAGGGDGGDKGAGGGNVAGNGDVKDADLGTIEERAARMGWAPKDKFRGDPEKWTDAATFVENGEKSLPILRERIRSLERTNVDLTKSVGDFKKMSETAFDRAYKKAKVDLQNDIKVAAKAGDDKGVDTATNELADLEREKANRDAASKADPVFDGWAGQNAWYNDPELKAESEVEAFRLRRAGDKTEGIDFLDKVKDAVKKRFPEKFGNVRRQQPGAVERSSGGGDESETRAGGRKGWDQLPTDAKEAGERYIKQKLYKDKAAYAAAFYAQN